MCRERGPPIEKIPRVSRKSTDFPPTDRLTAAARTKISTEEPVHVAGEKVVEIEEDWKKYEITR